MALALLEHGLMPPVFLRMRRQVRCAMRTAFMHELDYHSGRCRFCKRSWASIYPPAARHSSSRARPAALVTGTTMRVGEVAHAVWKSIVGRWSKV